MIVGVHRLSRLVSALALLGLLVAVLPAPIVHAANFLTVTNCLNGTATSLDFLVSHSGVGDTITFAVDCPDPGTFIAPAGQLAITHDLTIDGSGRTVVISGNNAHKVFAVTLGTLTINGLTIEKGNAMSDYGGGISIRNLTSSLIVTNSAFIGNFAPNDGGAIFISGSGSLSIVNSTFFNNRAVNGGAVAAGSTATIINSTIAGNVAAGGGGGLFAAGFGSTVKNTIVAGNTAPNATTKANCGTTGAGTIVEGGVGHNLEYGVGAPANTCGFAIAPQSGDPKLDAAPALNGGHTPSLKLLLDTAALDTADLTTCQNALPAGAGGLDQRGLTRFPTFCSIGAFEPQVVSATFFNTPQQTTVTTPFPAPISATLSDSVSNKLGGVPITFTAPTSGPSGTFPGSLTTVGVPTAKGTGIATAPTFTANTVPGPFTFTITIPGLSASNATLTNLVGPPAVIAAVASTTPQSTLIGTSFPVPLAVTVTDQAGNLLPGQIVTFTVPGSGASGTFAGGVNTATTNASGVATAPAFTANTTAGGYQVTASVNGLMTSFALTNTAGSPASMTVNPNTTPQSTPVGASFAAPLAVTVKDSLGNLVPGAVVTFTAPTSGASGSFTGGVLTAITNASGVATAPTFFANNTPGSYQVIATVNGLTTSFVLTNTAVPQPPSKPGAAPSGGVPSGGSRASSAPTGAVMPPPTGR